MRIHQKLALKWRSLLSLTTLSGTLVFSLSPVLAGSTPLTSATLRKVVNQVELLLKTEAMRRNARVNDRLTNGGDQIDTRKSSRAELKFNDGTVAKVGELATFRFTPNTRRFDLGNGTYLFLVPPGRGSTEFYTPNAKAGVRGSALFIRYNRETDTTIMGALTNNPLGPMDITTGGQRQDLYAGQMATVVKNRIVRVESFDLNTFLSTSPLYRDIDPTDPDLQAVRQEVSDAMSTQVADGQPIVPAVTLVATPTTPSTLNAVGLERVTSFISPDATIARKGLSSGQQSTTPPANLEPDNKTPQSQVVKPSTPLIQSLPDSSGNTPQSPVVKLPAPQIQSPPLSEAPVVKTDPLPIRDLDNDHNGHHRTYVTVLVDGKPVVYLSIDGKVDYSRVINVNPAPVLVQPAPLVNVEKPATVRIEPVTPPPSLPYPARPATSVVIEAPARVIEAPARVIEAPARVIEVAPPVIATPVPATTTSDIFSPSVVPVPATTRVLPPLVPVIAPVVVPPSVSPSPVIVTEPVVRPTAPAITAPPLVPTAPPIVVAEPVVRPTAPAITTPPLVPAAPVTTTPPVAPSVPIAPILVTPSVPVVPISPSVPIVPTAPIEPAVPVILTTPITASPVLPVTPIAPVAPIVPVVIQAPIAPVAPIVPVVIQTPVVPIAPVVPTVPVVPVVPAPVVTPAAPVPPVVPVAPAAVPVAPAAPSTPVKP